MSAATTSAAGRLTDAELKAQEKAARKAEKARQKRIAADEAAERKRSAKAGFANVNNPRRSTLLTVLCAVFAVYCLFPFVYLLINATKTQADFTSTFGLGFGKTFALFDNIATVFSYQDGIFARWLFNTILYVVVGAGGATLLAIMGGYALAKFRFPGRKAVFVVIIGAISVPGIALAVPQFLLFAKLGLTNTPWAMIIPSLISPFGLYLMWIFSEQAVPQELLEAARWLSYLKPDGQIVTNTQQIDPMPVITGAAQYPENLVEKMKAAGAKVDALDCLKLAEEAGSSKAVNLVLMGRLSHYFDLPEEAWMKSLEPCVPAKFLELNKRAFQLGKNA